MLTASSLAQYAMLVSSQSPVGITSRIMPCARSNSVSVTLRKLRPIRPIAPPPTSLSPVMNSMSGIVPLASCTFSTLSRAWMEPVKPLMRRPSGRARVRSCSCDAAASVSML